MADGRRRAFDSSAFQATLATGWEASRGGGRRGRRAWLRLTARRRGLSNTRLFRHRSDAHEAHLSAIEDASSANSRISCPPCNPRRARRAAGAPRQGPGSPGSVRSGCRLPRTARIRSDERARTLQAAGRQRGRWFLLRRAENDEGYARLLVRIAKPVMPSAVARNRMRRCVREVFRQRRASLTAIDYFVSLIQPYRESNLALARQELERLLEAKGR